MTPKAPPKTELPEPVAAALRNAKPAELLAMFAAICNRIETRRKIAPDQSGAESLYVAYIPPSGPQDGQLMFAGENDLLAQGVGGSLGELIAQGFQTAAEKGAAHLLQQQNSAKKGPIIT